MARKFLDKKNKMTSQLRLTQHKRSFCEGFTSWVSLKGERVKRKCISKTGKICFKGYSYVYSISSQGWIYLRYLNEPINLDRIFNTIKWNKFETYIRSVCSRALMTNVPLDARA